MNPGAEPWTLFSLPTGSRQANPGEYNSEIPIRVIYPLSE
jgi:hypothetical protein